VPRFAVEAMATRFELVLPKSPSSLGELVLDEITYPVNYGWIEAAPVWSAIRDRAARTNVFCTGRNAPPELVDLADTVTEMRMGKHAFATGVRAKRGIDF
jgi:cob(I)alamin adenosyltransferase